MNAGKVMERQWRKSAMRVEGLYYHRMNDGTASFYGGQGQPGIRFQQSSPYDCFMYYEPRLYLLELKQHKGKSIPNSAIRKNQLEAVAKASGKPGVVAGFVVHFVDQDQCWFADGAEVKEFVDTNERKSIPVAWFQDHGCAVALVHKKTQVEYDIQSLLDGPKPKNSRVGCG